MHPTAYLRRTHPQSYTDPYKLLLLENCVRQEWFSVLLPEFVRGLMLRFIP